MIELLIAMVIVVTCYSLAVGPTKEYLAKKRLAGCVENLRKQQLTLGLYANEHLGAYPVQPGAQTSDAVLNLLVPKYTSDPSIFLCPGGNLDPLPGGQPITGKKIGYAFCSGVTREHGPGVLLVADALLRPGAVSAGAPLFGSAESGPGTNHGALGGNLLFADGHVEFSGPRASRAITIPTGATLLNPRP
jgi:prepilin-type processing-associated H-X9-DG protein